MARCPLWTGSQSTHKFSKLISIHVLLLLIIIPNCGPISLPDPGGLKDAGRSLEEAQCLLGYLQPYTPISTLLFKPFLISFSALFFSHGCKSIEFLSRNRWSLFPGICFPSNWGCGRGRGGGGGVLVHAGFQHDCVFEKANFWNVSNDLLLSLFFLYYHNKLLWYSLKYIWSYFGML